MQSFVNSLIYQLNVDKYTGERMRLTRSFSSFFHCSHSYRYYHHMYHNKDHNHRNFHRSYHHLSSPPLTIGSISSLPSLLSFSPFTFPDLVPYLYVQGETLHSSTGYRIYNEIVFKYSYRIPPHLSST